MCTTNPRRRRSHQEMMRHSGPSTSYASNTVPVAAIYATEVQTSAHDDGTEKPIGIFRSHTSRLVLSISAVALLLISFTGMGSGGAPDLKSLSDTVMDLTQQLHKLGREADDKNGKPSYEELQKQLDEKKIELAWESQHVHDAQETQKMMFDSMQEEIELDHKIIDATAKSAIEVGSAMSEQGQLLQHEHDENANLKVALAFAIEELAKARAQLPPAPGTPNPQIQAQDLINNERRTQQLRSQKKGFQPGDNIEIIEYEDSGKIALRPGIVAEINKDGTFNLVKLEQSIVINNQKAGTFQSYLTYHTGMEALFEVSREVYVPITIVDFLPGSARPNFELHGVYQFAFNGGFGNPDQIREGQAMRMHRYAGVGEIIGDDPNDVVQ